MNETVVLPFRCGHRKAVDKLWAEKYGATTVQSNCPDCARLIWLKNHPLAAAKVAQRKGRDTAEDSIEALLQKLA